MKSKENSGHFRTAFVQPKIPFAQDTFNGMPYRNLGSSGLRVSSIGLGTWKMGHRESGDGSRIDERTAFEIFDRAMDLGITFWDTANRYNNASGNSERIIGAWIKQNHSLRRNVILATKLGGCMDGLTPNHCGLSRTNIIESVYASLERLQMDHIDLLYFHATDPLTPIEESLVAVEDLIRQDLVRYFAVSNFTAGQLDAYKTVESKIALRSKMVAVQNQFDLLRGESDSFRGVYEFATQNRISFIAWSPLGGGLLTDRYLVSDKVGAGDRLYDEGMMEMTNDFLLMEKLHKLAALAHLWNMPINQLVIAYMLTLPGMGPVIPASSNIDQLESNAAASAIRITEEQIKRIKEAIN
ncbi:MAG TPA: aldo/keto reductase [Puia sp.]|nr:aldo/keto reductase [Puia sp.]